MRRARVLRPSKAATTPLGATRSRLIAAMRALLGPVEGPKAPLDEQVEQWAVDEHIRLWLRGPLGAPGPEADGAGPGPINP